MKRGESLDYINIRLKAGDWDKLKAALKEDGYDETPQGVYDFLFDMITDDDFTDDDSEAENDDADEDGEPHGNPAIDKLFEYIQKNPEAIKDAAGLGKTVLTSFLKKKMGL